MISIYTRDSLPRDYYGRTYDLFSFEIHSYASGESEPHHLMLHTTSNDEYIMIKDLYMYDYEANNKFIEFLRSITVINGKFPIAMHHDFKYAKDKYGVDIKRINLFS